MQYKHMYSIFININYQIKVLEENKENNSKEFDETKEVKYQLTTANIMIKQLKDKLESNSNTRVELEQHVQELNSQINELLNKIKSSNKKDSEKTEYIATLQNSISNLDRVC